MKAKTGRPSAYNSEIADELCEAIARGNALYLLCENDDRFPSEATVYRWLEANEEFREKYTRSRARQADRSADEIIVIADSATDANLARVQIDARKWRASKLAPKKYGDKVALEHSGGVEVTQRDAAMERVRAALDAQQALLRDRKPSQA